MAKLDTQAEETAQAGERRVFEQIEDLFSAYVELRMAQKLRYELHAERNTTLVRLGKPPIAKDPPYIGTGNNLLSLIERATEDASRNRALDVIEGLQEDRRKVAES